MGRKVVSSFVRAQVVALHDARFSQIQISMRLNISRCCIQNMINKYKHRGIHEGSKRTGHPKKLDERSFRHLKRLAKDDARPNATKLASDLNASLPKLVTTRTVSTHLKELGFEYVVKVKTQWLGVQNRRQSAASFTKYLKWTSDDCKHVIFKDESTFYVLKRQNQCKIWRLEKEKSLPECLQQTNTGDGKKVGI